MKREVPHRQSENTSISNLERHETRADVTNENTSISSTDRHRMRANVTILRTRSHSATALRKVRHRLEPRPGSRTMGRRGALMVRPLWTSPWSTATWTAGQLWSLWTRIIGPDHSPNLDETTERAHRVRHRWRRLLQRMVQNHRWAAQGFELRCARSMPRRLDWYSPRGVTMQGQRWGWQETSPWSFGP